MGASHATFFSSAVIVLALAGAGASSAAIVTPISSSLISSAAVRTGASEGMIRIGDADSAFQLASTGPLAVRPVEASIAGPLTGQISASVSQASAAFSSPAAGALSITGIRLAGVVNALSPANGAFYSPTSLLYNFNLDEPSTLIVDFALSGVGRDFHAAGIMVDGVEQHHLAGFSSGSIAVPISAGDHSFEFAVFSTLAALTPGDLGTNVADAQFSWRIGRVPAPGALSLAGLAGLLAARRRRA